MDRFRKILVSVDATDANESPHSLIRAIRLARDTGAELVVVDVLSTMPTYVQKMFRGDDADELIAEELHTNLKVMCQRRDCEGLRITTKVLRGRPIFELLNEIESQGCDLLIRDVSGEEETGSLFFGSLDMRLMRNCPCPVWLVKPRPITSFERILVAIDPLPADASEERFNLRIIDLASSLAEWDKATLHVVAAWQVRGEMLLASRMKSEMFEEHMHDVTKTAKTNLSDALAAAKRRPTESNTRFKNGDPADVIREYAREIDADLIVMGTLARTGVPGLLIGNTAERVLRQVRSSVLTIKPKAFVSPVLSGESDGE